MAARINKGFFTKSAKAREALGQQAEAILAQYLEVIKKAQEAGNYDIAAKSLQWLIEHMPGDEDGSRIVDTSVDKPQPIEKKQAPPVQIGIQIGGVGVQRRELPEVTSEPIDD